MLKKIALGLIATAAMAGAAQAQDSQFGATSQDSIALSATLAPVVRVSGLPTSLTFTLGAAFLNNAGALSVTERPTYCIYSNVGSQGSYSLSVTGVDAVGGGSNSWALTGTAGEGELLYTVNHTDGAISRQVGPGDSFSFRADGGVAGDRPNTANCSDVGGTNAQLIIGFDKDDVLAANAGTFTGTLTVVASAT